MVRFIQRVNNWPLTRKFRNYALLHSRNAGRLTRWVFDSVERLYNLPLPQKLYHLPLPSFLAPWESPKGMLALWILALGLAAVIIAAFIRPASSLSFNELWPALLILPVRGAVEEFIKFICMLIFGNFGLLVGTLLWIVAHPFGAEAMSVYHLGSTILGGVLYLKIWRSRYDWSAYPLHALWNAAFVGVRHGMSFLPY